MSFLFSGLPPLSGLADSVRRLPLVDGVVAPDCLNAIDRLFAEDAARQVMGWEPPVTLVTTRNPAAKWRLVSSLQKAIRFGDAPAAIAAANACFDIDPTYLWRRLVMCAIEDVLLGDIYTVAATLAFAGSRRARSLAGDRNTALWVAAKLAGALKDRTAVNLCVLVDFNRDLHGLMGDWKHLPDEALASLATEQNSSVDHRMMAAWLLAGTKRFWNLNVPSDNDRPRTALMRLMADLDMPLALYYLADRAAIRGAGCMFVALLPVWQMLQREAEASFSIRTNVVPEGPKFGPILSAALDMHTREGRQAIRAFGEVQSIALALGGVADPQQRWSALCTAVFLAEGGKLERRLSHSWLDDLHRRAVFEELRYFGMADDRAQGELLRQIRLRLPKLNEMRGAAVRDGSLIEWELSAIPQATAVTPHLPLSQSASQSHQAPNQPIWPPLETLPDFDLERSIS